MADKPVTREEKYLAYLTGDYTGEIPKPITRKEKYLYELCLKGMGGEVSPEEIKNAVNEYLEKNPVKPGATTEQAQQIEQNKKDVDSLKEDISNKITKFYASSQGETHLADSDNGKIMDMMLYGKSEQKQYTGKNLIDIDTYYLALKQGDGTYKGAASDFSSIRIPVGKYVDTQISISCKISVPLETTRMYFLAVINNSSVSGGNVTAGKSGTLTITITPKTEKDIIRVSYGEGNLGVAVISEFQIEKGSEATSYEPYTGGIPSPNPSYPQEIKSVVNPTVKVCGKNLLKATAQTQTIKGVVFTNNGDGTYTVNGTNTTDSIAIFVATSTFTIKETGEYKLTGLPTGQAISDNIWFGGTKIESAKRDVVLNLKKGDSVNLAVIVGSGATVSNVLLKPMLSLDTTATYDDFEPYHEQTVTLPYTLNAIPVSSGGNVTIDGQEYVSDYFDAERGKLVRMCKEVAIKNAVFSTLIGTYSRIAVYDILPDRNIVSTALCNYSKLKDGFNLDESHWYVYNGTLWLFLPSTKVYDQDSLDVWLKNNDLKILVTNKTPEEIDLTPEEITALKALATYYPTTNISVNSEQLDGYTVFNYPISMENGWNYVKQQIGDTRDYIYDMDARTQDTDLQAAEAYVNSEYAVALTELEV